MKAIQKHSFSKWKLIILFWFLCLSLQHTDCSQGEEYSCEVMMKEACTYKIKGKITGKLFQQKRPFSLSYNSLKKSEKGVAVLAALFVWANSYHCDAAKGYICDEKVINNTFSVSVSEVENQSTIQACVEGTFTFSAEGDHGIRCKQTQNRTPVSHQDHDQHTEKGSVRPELNEAFLENRTPVSHQDYGQHPEKESVQLENNKTFLEKTSGNSNEPEKNFVWIGLSSGASFGCVPIIVLLFYYLSGKRHTFSGINTILPEHADLEEALDREDNRDTSQNLPFLETTQTTTVNEDIKMDVLPLQKPKDHL